MTCRCWNSRRCRRCSSSSSAGRRNIAGHARSCRFDRTRFRLRRRQGIRVERRAGDHVCRKLGKQVKQDARVLFLVKRHGGDAGGCGRAVAADDQIKAKGVVLRAVGITRRVQRNHLVSQNIVAGGNVRGQTDGPAQVVGQQLVGRPLVLGDIEQAGLADLEELQLGLVGGLAGTIAVGQIVEDRALVGGGPLVPLDLEGVAGVDGCSDARGCGAEVADNVRRGIAGGRDEGVGQVVGNAPADDNGRRVLVLVAGVISMVAGRLGVGVTLLI